MHNKLVVSKQHAVTLGLKYYFTGKPCKRGHVAERITCCGNCRQCSKEETKYRKEWKKRNLEKVKVQNQKYEQTDRRKQYHANRYLELRNEILERCAQWRKNNPGKSAAIVRKRQTALMQRIPKWADLDAIRKIYEESARLTKETGVKMHVDHVIPLQGKSVSGLHVIENLQILEEINNVRKHNKFAV